MDYDSLTKLAANGDIELIHLIGNEMKINDVNTYPDDYLYLSSVINEAVNNDHVEFMKLLFQTIPDIRCVLAFEEFLIEAISIDMLDVLYAEYLSFSKRDKMFLDILDESIRDLKEDNPDMPIIEYHANNIGRWQS